MSNFGKGITVASGFDLGAKAPLDSRIVVNNMTELQEHIDNNRVYDGMIIYVIEEKTTYQYLNPDLIVFGGSGDGSGSGIIIDNLNSILTNASLSANQGRVLREMIELLQENYYTKEEIDAIKETLENQDIEISQIVGDLEQYFPKKISYFENDMNYLTEDDLEETLKYITIPAKTSDLINDAGYVTNENIDEIISQIPIKTSQLENDAGYITEENLEENVVNKIPIKTSQLENDSGYITIKNVEDVLADMNIDGNTGDGFVHIGSELPPNEQYLWIDTSTPTKITTTKYDDRIKLKYIEMLDSTKNKLNDLSSKMTLIEENISKITSEENQDKIKTFRTTLSTTRNEINVLFLQIENLKTETLTSLRSDAKKIRKTVKKLIYSLIDFNDEVVRVLDSELIFDYSGGSSDDNNDDIVVVNNASILTEDGIALLTEDGLLILADGIEEVILPSNTILSESGNPLLTESGLILLADEIEESEILIDAILTELGYVIMTENGKQILKG